MMDLEFSTKYILAIIEFDYDSKDTRSKYTPNNVREAFLGEKKGSPKIPMKLKEMCSYEREIVFPIHFSLIKKPIKAELPKKDGKKTKNYTIKNTAVGSMILYEYLGSSKDFKKCCDQFEKLLKKMMEEKKPIYFEFIKNAQIIVGVDLKNVT